jgi:hypothetical protein
MSKYVRDKSHSKFEAYTKDEVYTKNEVYSKDEVFSKNEINTKFNEEADIYSGTTVPNSSLGKDGDIYLKYE